MHFSQTCKPIAEWTKPTRSSAQNDLGIALSFFLHNLNASIIANPQVVQTNQHQQKLTSVKQQLAVSCHNGLKNRSYFFFSIYHKQTKKKLFNAHTT